MKIEVTESADQSVSDSPAETLRDRYRYNNSDCKNSDCKVNRMRSPACRCDSAPVPPFTMVDTHPPRVSRQDRDLPPLQNGDRLSRAEFERRYAAMPDLKKAELIEGIVYMASPLRFTPHAEPHADLIGWLWTYKIATPGVRLGDNATVRLDRDNEPQPDALLLIDPACGGQAAIGAEGYVEGAPEFVAEIAASSAAIDLGDKQRVYRRNRVQEYWVWQVLEQKIDWFYLADDEYMSLNVNTERVIASRVFPGLWLDVAALLAGDMAQVLTVLHQGLASVEHQQFVRQLAQAGPKNDRADGGVAPANNAGYPES